MRTFRIPAILLVVAIAVAVLPATPADTAPPAEISVYAAASLRDALQDAAPHLESELGARPVFNFGSSSDLARQIIAAAKADNKVQKEGLVDAGSRHSFLSNRLVVIAPADSGLAVTSAAGLAIPAVRHLALANPEAVPAGKYARAWLEKAGAWGMVQERVVPTLDVRAALAAVESGAAEAGVVYRTDALISKRVRVIYEVPEREGPLISYSVAAIVSRPSLPLARRVVEWLAGPEGGRAFARFGFVVRQSAP